MRNRRYRPSVLLASGMLAVSGGAAAQNAPVAIPPPASETAALPSRGMSMAAVRSLFGEPASQSQAGGTGPAQPLIHRWDYPGFSVFFERSAVIDSVRPGARTVLHHSEELRRADGAGTL
jgi:hypothetical protein